MSSAKAARVYLLPSEAADRLGVSRRALNRRILLQELPALRVSPRIWRVEARALGLVHDPLGGIPETVTTRWCRERLRVSERQLLRLVQSGQIPMTKRSALRHAPWTMTRREFVSWVIDNTTGDA